MNELIGSSLISGGTGLLGGLFSMFGQNRNIDKQINAQKEENALNREYNLNLAKLQNQWSIEQWNRENAYNTPAAQYQRMKDSPLNPDLMYGNGGVSNVAGVSPEMTAGAPSSPVDMSNLANKQTYGEVISGAVNQALTGARIGAMKSESEKREREGKLIDVQASLASADLVTRAAQNELALQLSNSQIYLNHSLAELNHSKKEEIAAKINNLNADTQRMFESINVLKSQARNLDAETVQYEFERWYKSELLEQSAKRLAQEIKESNARIELTEQQAKDILATQGARLLNLNSGFIKNQAEAEKLYAELGIIGIQADTMKFNLDTAKDWVTFDKTVDAAQKIISSIGQAVGAGVGAFFGFRGLRKPTSTPPPYNVKTLNKPHWDGSPSW